MAWTCAYGKGRVFHNAQGHDVPSMLNYGFIQLTVKGTEWASAKGSI